MMIDPVPTYQRETVEFQPVDVTFNEQPVTDASAVEFALTTGSLRPTTATGQSTDWFGALLIDGELGFMVEGLALGYYDVWVRVADNPETTVEKTETGFVVV